MLHGVITKNAISGDARRVGGVCVSGDEKMWNDPHYLQMVLKDPESLTCKGLVLMHEWQEGDKRYLIASLNPSSTYLYGVDQKACFQVIEKTLIDFAKKNNIDAFGFSQNNNIRTNRTGGKFESAMNTSVRNAREKYGDENSSFSFAEEKQFSTSPSYSVKNVDLIWMKE